MMNLIWLKTCQELDSLFHVSWNLRSPVVLLMLTAWWIYLIISFSFWYLFHIQTQSSLSCVYLQAIVFRVEDFKDLNTPVPAIIQVSHNALLNQDVQHIKNLVNHWICRSMWTIHQRSSSSTSWGKRSSMPSRNQSLALPLWGNQLKKTVSDQFSLTGKSHNSSMDSYA